MRGANGETDNDDDLEESVDSITKNNIKKSTERNHEDVWEY